MELREDDKNMISAINSNNIEEIHKYYIKGEYNINIFKKENIYLFDKNAKYLSYFRGYYYWLSYNDIKTKKLMKYNNPFIFLFHHLGITYYDFKKYNKAMYCLKRKKYNDYYQLLADSWLYNIYSILNKKFKLIYYYLRSKCTYAKKNINCYIFFILNKK